MLIVQVSIKSLPCVRWEILSYFNSYSLIKHVANSSQRWRGLPHPWANIQFQGLEPHLPEDPRLPKHLGWGRKHRSRSEVEISWQEKIRLRTILSLQGALSLNTREPEHARLHKHHWKILTLITDAGEPQINKQETENLIWPCKN